MPGEWNITKNNIIEQSKRFVILLIGITERKKKVKEEKLSEVLFGFRLNGYTEYSFQYMKKCPQMERIP